MTAARGAEVCFSLDVEEFDVPLEYGQWIPADEQDGVAAAGLRAVLGLLDELAVPATLFCTALFAEHHAGLIRGAAAAHEIASHGVRHARLEPGDLRRSRERLERVAGTPVRGFRAPRMEQVAAAELLAAGYAYDSSDLDPRPVQPLAGAAARLPARRALVGAGLGHAAAPVPALLAQLQEPARVAHPPGLDLDPARRRLPGAVLPSLEFADLAAYPLPCYVRGCTARWWAGSRATCDGSGPARRS